MCQCLIIDRPHATCTTWTTWSEGSFITRCYESCQALAVEQDELQERVRLTTLLTIGKTIVLNFENTIPEYVMCAGFALSDRFQSKQSKLSASLSLLRQG